MRQHGQSGQALIEFAFTILAFLTCIGLAGFVSYRGYLYFRFREEVYESLVCIEKFKSTSQCQTMYNLRLYQIALDRPLILLKIRKGSLQTPYSAELKLWHQIWPCRGSFGVSFLQQSAFCHFKLERSLRLPLIENLRNSDMQTSKASSSSGWRSFQFSR